ncbi:MAG: flippase [Aquisalimonadaceae bacterium]
MIRGSSGSLVLKLTNTALSLILAIVLARVLGPEGYGIYAFAFSVVSLLSIPMQVGLPTLLVREVARYQLYEQWSLLRGLLKYANIVSILLAAIIVPVSVAVIWFVFRNPEDNAPRQLLTFYWALALAPLIALGGLRGAALRGLRKVVQGQLPDMLLRPGLLLVLTLVVALSADLTPERTMALHALAAALAFAAGAHLLNRHLPSSVRQCSPSYERLAWLRSVIPLSLLAGMQAINGQIDIVMLGIMTTTKEEVGVYRVVVQGATLVTFGLAAANMVVAPHFARLYRAGDRENLQALVTTSSRWILALALPVGLTLIFFGQFLLMILFGREYLSGYLALSILCTGQLANAACGSVGYLLAMTGYENDALMGRVIAISINVALNVALIPLFGIYGAATATAISLIILNVYMCFCVNSRMGIHCGAFRFKNA